MISELLEQHSNQLLLLLVAFSVIYFATGLPSSISWSMEKPPELDINSTSMA
jgi:hypothetical protein